MTCASCSSSRLSCWRCRIPPSFDLASVSLARLYRRCVSRDSPPRSSPTLAPDVGALLVSPRLSLTTPPASPLPSPCGAGRWLGGDDDGNVRGWPHGFGGLTARLPAQRGGAGRQRRPLRRRRRARTPRPARGSRRPAAADVWRCRAARARPAAPLALVPPPPPPRAAPVTAPPSPPPPPPPRAATTTRFAMSACSSGCLVYNATVAGGDAGTLQHLADVDSCTLWRRA